MGWVFFVLVPRGEDGSGAHYRLFTMRGSQAQGIADPNRSPKLNSGAYKPEQSYPQGGDKPVEKIFEKRVHTFEGSDRNRYVTTTRTNRSNYEKATQSDNHTDLYASEPT